MSNSAGKGDPHRAMPSSSDRFLVIGEVNGTGGDDQLLLDHHHHHGQPSHHQQQIMYHVPQHSRREKLRFPSDGSPPPSPPPTSLLQFHDADVAAPSTFYHASALPSLFSSSSRSSSLSCYYSQNPSYCCLADPAVGQALVDPNAQTLRPDERHLEISPQRGFSLSLSSMPRQPHQFGVRPAPLGPFTGYAAVLNRSRFLEPARKLLEEVCGAAEGGGGVLCGDGDMLLDADPMEEVLADHCRNGFSSDQAEPSVPSESHQYWKKTKLIAMLDEVYRRYKQYHQQVQDIITSFESVAGLSTAAPYASMALKIMYKNFRYLKNVISDQLCHLSKVLGKEGRSRSEDVNAFGLVNAGGCVLRSTNSAVAFIGQPHVWRPQRGLPERAVSVLRAWLFEHFLHPYPTDTDKQMLAKQTGLTRNQVSNWFINARVRLWKPMVEEVHSLDMQQRQQPAKVAGGKHARQPSSSDPSHFIPEHLQVCSTAMNPPPPSPLAKSIRQEVKQTSNPSASPVNFVYGDLSNDHHYNQQQHHHHHPGVNMNNSSVSLTLGLHQNDGIRLGERLPVNVARRFGLDECNDAYALSAYSPQPRPFGKDVSNHLLHDFVG